MKSHTNLREIRESTDAELRERLARLGEELFGYRMKRYTNQLENTMKIRQTRREIARIKTVLAARAVGVEQHVATSTPEAQE